MTRIRRTGRTTGRTTVALAVCAVSLFAVTACGSAEPAPAVPVPAGAVEPVAVTVSSAPAKPVLPSKADLGARYLAIVGPYNTALDAVVADLDAESAPLSKRRAAAGKVADANWALTGELRALKESIVPPATGYPAEDASFYRNLYAALATMVEENMSAQVQYTAMRDAISRAEFDVAYAGLYLDGVAPRRVRSMLGLPDVPGS
jgi:hypothetical protein